MASETFKECGVCEEEFNDNQRCPRNLPCFHCICTRCIEDLIKNNMKECPFCRKSFEAASPQDFRINTNFLDLLKYTRYLESKVLVPSTEGPTKGQAMSRAELVTEMKKSFIQTNKQTITSCREAKTRIEANIQRNTNLKHIIATNHKDLKQEIMNSVKEMGVNCILNEKYLDDENKVLEKQLQDANEFIKALECARLTLDDSTAMTKVSTIIEEAEEAAAPIQSWLRNFNDYIPVEDKIYKGMEEDAQSTKDKIEILLSVLKSREKCDLVMDEIFLTARTRQDAQKQSTTAALRRMSPVIKYLVKLGRLQTIHEHDGKIYHARFSMSEDNKVLFHCYRKGEPDPHVCTIQHSDVMELVDADSRMAFLEYGSDQSVIGKVIMSVSQDTKRGQNFMLLCSGERGISYVDTNINRVWNKGKGGECIIGGDYETQDGTGGKTLIPGAGEERGGPLKGPDAAGTVFGIWNAGDEKGAQFEIRLRDRPGYFINEIFGKVESGQHVLQEAVSKFSDIRQVRIVDCGLVFPI